MADHMDEDIPATEQAAAPAEQPGPSPTIPQDDGQPEVLPEEPGDDPADDAADDATADPADGLIAEPPADRPADEAPEEEATAAPAVDLVPDPAPTAEPAAATAEPSAPAAPELAPSPEPEPVDEPVGGLFGAQFSSPEPTTVTARPRRRATRPALSADPDSVEPAPAPAAPVIPAFVTFVAPEPEVAAPRRRSRRAQAESPVDAPVETPAAAPADGPSDAGDTPEDDAPAPRRGRSRRRALAEPSAADDGDTAEPTPRRGRHAEPVDAETDTDTDEAVEETDTEDAEDRDSDDTGSGSRRRRRGRRGRGRGRSGDDGAEGDEDAIEASAEDVADEADTPADASADEPAGSDDAEDEDDTEDGDAATGSTTRRRRRRRRRGESSATSEDAPEDADDRPERAGRNGRTSSDDDVRGVAGSTRLEAKRQRRREGRDGGRRRAPILSESEFLARREAVDRAMVIRQQGERTQIAVLEDDVLVEHYVTQAQATSFAGNVYLGRVQNVLPSMEAAFVDIGKGRNAVLYAGEVNWDAAGLTGKSRSIEQAMKSGDKVLVQVTKDPIGHKGARLTQQINLPGRFLVYVPGGSMTGISRKLPDKERTRLKDVLKKIVPEDAGVIIRTAAEGASEEELTRDVARLQAQWEVIQTKASSTSNAPTLLYGEPDLAIRVIRDVFNEDFKRLVVQGDDAWDTVEAYVAHVSPELSERLQRYTGTGDVFRDLRIDEQLMKALDRKVWLPSGGSLVIDRTEAMTVVDVNTGKFVGSGGNLEQTVTRNNIEAAEEIVRQLRLRDIGGMIVIDFIDMVLESNRDLVLRRLTECLGRDRTKHQVAEVTSLGLVQMTRKRVGQGLLEVFSEPCEHCRGRGVVVSVEPVDEKRRSRGDSPGSGGGSNSGGNGGGGNGGGRRDRDRSGRDQADQGRAETVEQPAGEAPATDDTPETADTPSEGRSGRRSRGRRGRGQSGEARAAEDAAVLAGTRDADGPTTGEVDAGTLAEAVHESVGEELAATAVAAPDDSALPEPDEDDAPTGDVPEAGDQPIDQVEDQPTEQAGVPVPESAAPESAGTGDTPSLAAELSPAELPPVTGGLTLTTVTADDEPAPGPSPDGGPQGSSATPEAAEPAPQPAAEESVVEPVEDEPVVAPARPRRRRAASRPAGPPA
ncbi:Rne/Rng family ribonuclease [Modestobacter sp. URMC 112]